ncbi:LysR substrate-binding domain-containing protein, partial [Acinetobacter baumannii]
TIGVRYFADRADDLDCHAMPPEPLAVICPPGHPVAGQRIGRLAELQAAHWLVFPDRVDSGEAAAGTLSALFLVRGIADLNWSAIDSLT